MNFFSILAKRNELSPIHLNLMVLGRFVAHTSKLAVIYDNHAKNTFDFDNFLCTLR